MTDVASHPKVGWTCDVADEYRQARGKHDVACVTKCLSCVTVCDDSPGRIVDWG